MILNCSTWDNCEIREGCKSKHFPATSNPCKGACLEDPAAIAESWAEYEQFKAEVASLPGPAWEVKVGKGWASISIWPTKGWIVFRWDVGGASIRTGTTGVSSHVLLSGPQRLWTEIGQREILRSLRANLGDAYDADKAKLIAAIEAQMRPAPKQMEIFQ